MKLNKTKLFILIWLVHLFIYYLVYLLSIAIIVGNAKLTEIYKVIFGFAFGIYGGMEQIPAFFLIPLVFMLVLINFKLKKNWLKAFIISTSICYLVNYLWMLFNGKHKILFFMSDAPNLIYFIIPSLVISIALNWFIFRKTYKKLGL